MGYKIQTLASILILSISFVGCGNTTEPIGKEELEEDAAVQSIIQEISAIAQEIPESKNEDIEEMPSLPIENYEELIEDANTEIRKTIESAEFREAGLELREQLVIDLLVKLENEQLIKHVLFSDYNFTFVYCDGSLGEVKINDFDVIKSSNYGNDNGTKYISDRES